MKTYEEAVLTVVPNIGNRDLEEVNKHCDEVTSRCASLWEEIAHSEQTDRLLIMAIKGMNFPGQEQAMQWLKGMRDMLCIAIIIGIEMEKPIEQQALFDSRMRQFKRDEETGRALRQQEGPILGTPVEIKPGPERDGLGSAGHTAVTVATAIGKANLAGREGRVITDVAVTGCTQFGNLVIGWSEEPCSNI